MGVAVAVSHIVLVSVSVKVVIDRRLSRRKDLLALEMGGGVEGDII